MIVIFVSNFRLYQEDNWVILENRICHGSDGGAEAFDEIERVFHIYLGVETKKNHQETSRSVAQLGFRRFFSHYTLSIFRVLVHFCFLKFFFSSWILTCIFFCEIELFSSELSDFNIFLIIKLENSLDYLFLMTLNPVFFEKPSKSWGGFNWFKFSS